MAIGQIRRAADVRVGVRVEQLTVAYMVLEAIAALAAGVAAGSFLLIAFGLDSVVELVSATVLLWRLSVEAGAGAVDRVEQAERQATWVTAVALVGLCLYVLATSAYGLLTSEKP